MKSDQKGSKCNANKLNLNSSFIMKLPSLLFVNTVRSPQKHFEKVIRTATDVPSVFSLFNYRIADYDKKDGVCTYILTRSINYKGEYSNSAHVTYLFPPDSTVATYISDQNIRNFDLENLLRSKSSTTDTHTHTHKHTHKHTHTMLHSFRLQKGLLPKICHAYPTMVKLRSYTLPKEDPKNIKMT